LTEEVAHFFGAFIRGRQAQGFAVKTVGAGGIGDGQGNHLDPQKTQGRFAHALSWQQSRASRKQIITDAAMRAGF